MTVNRAHSDKHLATYFASFIISLLGNSIASVVLPVLVLMSTGNVMLTGVVAVTGGASTFVLGLLSGPLIDRYDRRLIAAASDFISASSIGLLAVVGTVGHLTPTWFIISAVLSGIGDLPAWNAREAMIYGLQRCSQKPLQTLVGIRETASALAVVVGPTLAGLLMTILDDHAVLWVTTVTSFVAGVLCLATPREFGTIEHTNVEGSRLAYWGSFYEGIKFLGRAENRALTHIISLSVASVALVSILQSLLIPLFMTHQGMGGANGYAIGAVGLGLLVGGVVYAVMGSKVAAWPLIVVASLLNVTGLALLVQFYSVTYTIIMCFVFGLSSAAVGAATGVVSLQATPDQMRGRVNGLQNSLAMVVGPLSTFAVAWLVAASSVQTGGWVLVGFWVVVTVLFLGSSAVRQVIKSANSDDMKQAT